ncbi:PTS system fructose-specific transporter subunit IIA [Klebsiella pneumoniae]|nr:PTS system fructose-specific transporter subunit IIA [Klebsiella pneumoniae]
MNIVGVTACTVGIAHTYIAQKKIETAAKKAGHNVKIETQGTIGIENPLTADEIAAADIVLLAADVKPKFHVCFLLASKITISRRI